MIQPEVAFRAVLEAAPDAMLGVDEAGIIIWANSRVEELFGWPSDELVGQSVDVLVPDSVRALHPAHRAEYVKHPTTRPMGLGLDLSARRRDGSTFPAEISLSSVTGGSHTVVMAAVRDATETTLVKVLQERLRAQTEREALEAELQQSRRLESLGQLAGGVAHDFNNLLAAILNYASFARDDVARFDLPPARTQSVLHDLDQVLKAVDRAATLTNQLLTFSRRETIRPELVDLNDVVRGLTDLLDRTLGDHVELDVDLDDEPVPVLVDRGQLEQVLVNLAVNARDAMTDGGTLIIDTARIQTDADYAATGGGPAIGRYARIRVSDTGTGMPPDVAARAFEPFFTTKPHGEGTGLGLATVYGIVTQAGGLTRIYSEPDHGTSVVVLLPLAVGTPAADRTDPAAEDLDGDGEMILVVEDDVDVREVTTRLLRQHGYQVLVADDAHAAIDLARGHIGRIDLLLSDVIMPQMLGKEVAEHVRALRPGVPVLFMSGYAAPVLTSRGTLTGANGLVDKPFSAATLLGAIRRTLSSQRG